MRKVYCLSIYSRYLVKSFAFSTIPCAFPHFPPSFPHHNFAELCIFIHNLFYDCSAICSRIMDTAVYIRRNMSATGDTYVRNCWIFFHSFKLKICFPHILRKSFAQDDDENCRLLKVRVLSFRFASFLLFFNTVIRASFSISRRQKRHTHFTLHVPLLSPIQFAKITFSGR